TCQTIKEVDFSELHVFPYSPRKNTPAARMKDQVNGTVKQERVNHLLEMSKELNEKYAKKQIGRALPVLFETREEDYLVGHADNYLKVKVKTKQNLIGDIKNVIIEEYQDILIGSVI
ncbi:MAG: tRNA (N(6)-L-threonylcarbamoyladenosine(37)-C(2))-methylthiotransferase MtaB, partial [Coprobacillaceae bacterium]